MVDQKKFILNKILKNKQTAAAYATTSINSSFNDQLMNQTNFGFNPARQTLAETSIHVPGSRLRDRPTLNTQKRQRNITIDSTMVRIQHK